MMIMFQSGITHDDYVPEWHVKMSSKLMEDLEGNGVEYSFLGGGGTGVKKAADFTRSYTSDRTYDFILEMDVGTNPGDADDLAEAITNGIGASWAFLIKAKDGKGNIIPLIDSLPSVSGVDISAAP